MDGLDDLGTTITDLFDKIQRQSRMTHSGIAISTTAILDSRLELALKRALRPLSNNLYDRLFGSFRPLGTFSGKIVMAYALGVISTETHEELEKIRQIRNVFAHSPRLLDFGSADIAPIFASLKRPHIASSKPAVVFVACAQIIDSSLKEYLIRMGAPQT